MSEEEALKILNNQTDYICEDKDEAIKILLNLYYKQKAKYTNYIFKVADLIAFYKRDLFDYISIEFRNKNNYMIKNVKYGCFEDYIKNEDFKQEEVKEFFFRDANNLVILINKE